MPSTEAPAELSLSDRVLWALSTAEGIVPSYEELAEAIGVGGRGSVGYQVDKLAKAELVTRRPRIPRSLMLTEQGKERIAQLTEERDEQE